MALRKLVPLSLVLVLVLFAVATQKVTASSVRGSPSAPAAPLGPNSPLGESFTYQGQLKDDAGNPIDDTCAFRFRLYDAETFGEQVGSNQELPAVSVVNGYFIVQLNFGRVAFSGEARWLDVAVKCSGELNFTVLSPRQELTPAPYALDADLLDGEHATAFADAAHTPWGESWSGSGTGLSLSGGTTGLSGSGSTYGVFGASASTSGYGVYGLANSPSGITYGVRGESDSTSGRGVYGVVSALGGYTYGVYGVSDSTQGRGVYGAASAASGDTYGVFGSSVSPSGRGVYGYASATTGATFGVRGDSESNMGFGVYGVAISTSGDTSGVVGISYSTVGKGVYGFGSASSGQTYGVYGLTVSPDGRAVSGYANSVTGTAYGVLGTSVSTSGIGVYGYATDTDGGGTARGVVGRSDAPNGWGVQGHASNLAGTGMGVYGRSDAPDGFGVVGNAPGASVGVGAWSETSNLVEAYDGTYPGGQSRFYINQLGDVYADGLYYTWSINRQDGEAHALASLQSSEAWLEDFGRASLVDGMAIVSIPADFAGMADLSAEYFVFITLEGDCQGVYITNKTPTSFEVREVNDGKSSIRFGYRIVARPTDGDAARLLVVQLPDPADAAQQPDEPDQSPELPQDPAPADPGPNGQESQP